MEAADFGGLIAALHGAGYKVLGPQLVDEAIGLAEVTPGSAWPTTWPVGYKDEQAAGRYRLRSGHKGSLFDFNAGPHSLKRLLLPPSEVLLTTIRKGPAICVEPAPLPTEKVAVLGVRACDVAALRVLDQVFLAGEHPDPGYAARRRGLFLVGVQCVRAGGTCFCDSMGTGPQIQAGVDLVLTEVCEESDHHLLLQAQTAAGQALAAQLKTRAAHTGEVAHAQALVQAAKEHLVATRAGMPGPAPVDHGPGGAGYVDARVLAVKEKLAQSLDHPRFDEVAARCLLCANCTLSCPTCFCSSIEDVPDLTGTVSVRQRNAASCFQADFSYLHGGAIRQSPKSRYRQWLTHKFSTWVDQFGVPGCVGCGRCITFCPVGIDITAELSALTATVQKSEPTEQTRRPGQPQTALPVGVLPSEIRSTPRSLL